MQIDNFELRLTNRDVSAIAARLKRDTGLSHSKTIDAIAGALGFEGGNAMMSLLKAPKAHKASATPDPDASYNPFMDADLAKIARGDGAAFLAYLRSRSKQHNAIADYLEKHPEILSAPDFSIDCWAIAASALRAVSEEDHKLGAHYIGQEHYTAIRSDLAALKLPFFKKEASDDADEKSKAAEREAKIWRELYQVNISDPSMTSSDIIAYMRKHPELHDAVADYIEARPDLLAALPTTRNDWFVTGDAFMRNDEWEHQRAARAIGQDHYDAIRAMIEARGAGTSPKSDIVRDAAQKAGKPAVDIPLTEIGETDSSGMPTSHGFGAPKHEPVYGTLEDFLGYLVSNGHDKVAAFLRSNPEAVRFSPEMEGSAPTPADWNTVASVMAKVNFDDFLPEWTLRVIDRRIGTEYREALLRHLRSL